MSAEQQTEKLANFIQENYPREITEGGAGDVAIKIIKKLDRHTLIDFDWVITNGYIDKETINKREEKGWNFVVTIPAKLIHPSACDPDKATIFTKYTPYPKDEDIQEQPIINE